MSSNKKDKQTDPLVLELMDRFEWAWNDAQQYLRIMQEIQQNYDNQADEFKWPTVTNMPVPSAFNAVEKALPQAIDFLFPRKEMIRLTPLDDTTGEMKMEQVQRAERFLEHQLRSVMKLKKNAFKTIKDCYKQGIGYGIVEQINVTPFVSDRIHVAGGTKDKTTRQMILSKDPVRSLRYKYINAAQIIPTPDGSECNGPKRASTIYYFDIYNEQEFRDLMSKLPVDGDPQNARGDVEEIIQLARDREFSTRVPIQDMIAELAGAKMKARHDYDKHMPVQIPVIKCYSEKQHVWIAVGERNIWKEESTYQTLRCPICKATAWPDSDRWFPTSPPWVTRRLARGYSVFVNALMDMLTQYFDPPMVYNSVKLQPHGVPEGMPGEKIAVEGTGTIQDAIGYLQSPPIPGQIFTIGDMLKGVFGDAVNQPEFLNNPTAGVMRGGGFAFGDANKPITMRDALAAAILETNWLDDVVTQTMIEVQTMAMAGSGKLSYVDRVETYDPETDRHVESIEKIDVTEEDIVRVYNIEIDLDIKHSNSVQETQARFGEYDRLINNPLCDQYEVTSQFVNDDAKFRRLVPSRKKARQEQEERRQAELEAIRTGQANAQIGAPEGNAGEQALAGAGAAALGG